MWALRSRTVLVAVLMGILGVLESNSMVITSMIEKHWGVDTREVYVIIFSIIMIYMRVITETKYTKGAKHERNFNNRKV
jgi:hypothetical protein